ncbi:MAG TPA: hypothetical protein VFL80_08230, partial [Thermoanaerobaculia bacterium]|nr:hypothetical protein [Thermoanaerobaculia bacterium]
LAIERLTNVDVILLMNFFGPLVGVLMTVAVADAARRLSGSFSAAVVAGVMFATMIGGPRQYFVMGGSFETDNPSFARSLLSLSYEQVPSSGEFDVLFTVFQRQTSTLPQELAIVLLFPAALFLLEWFRSRERWRLLGFVGCTAAIIAVHSGVVIPLLILSAAVVVGAAAERALDLRSFRRAALAGFVGIVIGASWTLGFIAYPSAGGGKTVSTGSYVGSTALYYFPFLRPLAGESDPASALMRDKTYTDLTPFLIGCAILALLLPFLAWRDPAARRGSILFISAAVTFFFLAHGATLLRIPALVEVRRNATWFAMAVAILASLATIALRNLLERWAARSAPGRIRWGTAVPIVVLVLWGSRVPSVAAPALRQKIVDYSGYGATAYAVVRITREIEPFTWTLVTYGQEYPMVLGRGFHIPAVEFLERYDPGEAVLRIPTPYVFVVVEKTPHRFQINTWAARFSREDVERRLQTWCYLYQLSHDDIRLFLDNEQVSVYEIRRSAEEINRMIPAATRG